MSFLGHRRGESRDSTVWICFKSHMSHNVLEASLPVRQFQEVVEPLRHEAKRKLGPWSQGAWKASRSKFLQEWVAIKKKWIFPIMASYPACVLSFSHTFPSYTQAFAVRPDVLIKVRHKPTQCSYLENSELSQLCLTYSPAWGISL